MKKRGIAFVLLVCLLVLAGCAQPQPQQTAGYTLDTLPAYASQAYIALYDNHPQFTQKDYTTRSYEYYSQLDSYNRCGYVMACIGTDLMPTEERGSIGQVKPSGWQMAKYDFVDGKYLYNRCHLIGFQLTGENANEQNLITGTRYLNIQGMLPFENMVADYIRETGNHVLYRVTPDFRGEELVARGVQMEGWSVEDGGEGICFHVYAYNVQPGICIDYATGESKLDEVSQESQTDPASEVYILNVSSRKFHDVSCGNAQKIKQDNQQIFTGSREELIEKGYQSAGCCNP